MRQESTLLYSESMLKQMRQVRQEKEWKVFSLPFMYELDLRIIVIAPLVHQLKAECESNPWCKINILFTIN